MSLVTGQHCSSLVHNIIIMFNNKSSLICPWPAISETLPTQSAVSSSEWVPTLKTWLMRGKTESINYCYKYEMINQTEIVPLFFLPVVELYDYQSKCVKESNANACKVNNSKCLKQFFHFAYFLIYLFEMCLILCLHVMLWLVRLTYLMSQLVVNCKKLESGYKWNWASLI